MDVGTNVWVKTTDAVVWAAGKVIGYDDVTGLVQVRRSDTDTVVARRSPGNETADLCLRNMSVNLSTTSSLTCLEHLHEAALLQALSDRFAHNEIYTFIGDILVALNPLKPLPTLYAATQLDAYKRTMRPSASALALRGNAADKKGQLSPHVFAIGGKAFGGLWNATGRTNQSILVSGESGSGKTESTKFLMQFLTSVGRDAATDPVKTNGAVDIGRRILQTNPILESFGNAQTIRNDNSSRFGKFIKIQFSAQHEIVGAQIVSYLLEKVRVLHQNPGERSFHIFYELLEGADAELLRGLGLERGGTYELLHSYGPRFARQRAMTERYAQLFVETVRAFEDTGVEESERLAIFKILAALLHLGNVNFTVASGQESDATVVTAQSRFHLEKCAELMGVSMDELEMLLSSREIKAGAEVMVLKHDPVQAKEICRSLAKAVYGRLFTWLVRRLSDGINYYDSAVSISDESDELATIGILDIFGFESLNSNGFEQLCINYANERLQAQFNEFVFEREQQVYIAESINWRNISYPSNAACLALFDDKSNGLFSLLDQECLMPKGSNQALSTKFYRYHGGDGRIETTGLLQQPQLAKSTLPQLMSSFSKYLHRSESQEKAVLLNLKKHTFSASKMERVNHQFVVHHFAGRVCYNVEQFIEKNSDTLPADAGSILSSSRNEVVKAIGAEDDVDLPGADNASAGRRRYSMLRAPSVSAQFKNQLDRLLVQIGRTEAHYIRCLKPNELKKPGVFDRLRVVEQMRSVGVLEAVRIARHGYPVRLAHASFIDLFSGFKCFLSERDRSMTSHDLAQALVAVLLAKDFREDTVDCEGKRHGVLTAVTEYGNERVLDHDECHKDVQVGKTLVFCRSSTYTRFCRYRLELRNHRATVLQKHYRGYRRRKWFQELRAVVVHAQAIVRGFLGRRRVDKLRLLRRANAATRIQACWKRSAAQHKVEGMRKAKRYDAAVRLIQMRVRCFLAQRHFAKALDDKRCLAQRKRDESLNEKREHAAASIIQKHSRRWIDENRCATMKLQRFRLMMAFNKLRRACLASPATSEVEAEPSPSDECSTGSSERCQESKSLGDELTRPSLEREDSSTCDDRMEPLICVSASTYRPSNSRQRSRANSGSHRRCRSSSRDVDRNTLLENEILRLQQMLADHRSGRDGHSRDRWRRSLNNACPRQSVSGDEHSVRAPRPDRRRYSTDGTLSEDEGGEIDDNVSLLPPRRAQSVVPGKQFDHVSLLSRKIEELDEKCKFLEHVMAHKNYEEATHESFAHSRRSLCGRERFPSADGSLCGDPSVSEAGSDVDSIIFSIQNQMDKLRQSIAVKEQVLQTSGKSCTMSFSSSTRPTRSSSAASTTSFPNFLMGEVPRSLSSLPLSESQLSTGGSPLANSRRSGGSSLGLPLTPTSSVASSLYQVPLRSAPAHFGGPGMPRIVKWARSNNCYECEEPFNLFVRRHHCRMCGNSFCHEHSNRRVSVFGIGFDDGPVRVCDKCFTEYYEAPQAPLPPQCPSQYGFASSAMSTSSRYNGL